MAANEPLQLERVYQEIKWRIVYGRYVPGFVLSEGMLARVHRASRTPVRDALSRLDEEGYVERVPRRGYLVARLTMATIAQTFEVRQALEVTAAGLAAEAAARKAQEHGMKKVDVFVKGPGSGRETAIRSLQSAGLEVGSIQDVTPQAHNGCRPPKRRRV